MKYELNREDWHKLSKDVKELFNEVDKSGHSKAEKYYIELKAKDRSYNQLKLYWGEWLPAILYFLKDDIKLNTVEELHIYLKEYYCYVMNKSEYFREVEMLGKKRYICFFSINFNDCKQDIFNEYMDFILDYFYKIINVNIGNIDDLIIAYKQAITITGV